jgi:UDP-2,3-diacylglucosamine hydrolase
MNTIYFTSDHHFGEFNESREKFEKFKEFIEQIKPNSQLFIVGDLFDFYFEYKTQVPIRSFKVFRELVNLRKKKVKITYLVGNHDFWVGKFVEKELGIKVYKKSIEINLQGKRILVSHGDEFIKVDPFSLILHNKLAISLFYTLHPDFAYLIGKIVSKLCGKETKITAPLFLYRIVNKHLSNQVESIILGHIHDPIHIKVKNKDFILIGDWRKHFTYVKLEAGEFILCKWK